MAKARTHAVTNGVWWIKALGGILATETVLLRRGHNVDTQGAVGSTCKLCEEIFVLYETVVL